MNAEQVKHVRSDALASLSEDDFVALAERLASEREYLATERESLLQPFLDAIESADIDGIQRITSERDRIDERLKALALASAVISVEFDRRKPSWRHLAQGERAEGRRAYVDAIVFAYEEFVGLEANELTVTWRTQAEVGQLEADQRLQTEALARASMASS